MATSYHLAGTMNFVHITLLHDGILNLARKRKCAREVIKNATKWNTHTITMSRHGL
jgi:hypothetical protein